MPEFLFVESNTTGTGEIFLSRAADLGFQPVLLTRDPARYAFLRKSQAQRVAVQVTETRDRAGLLAAVRARKSTVAGVFTASDYFCGTAAWLAGQLGLPGADHEAIDACRCKAGQRAVIAESAPALNPRWTLVTASTAADAAAVIGLPVVVKPCDGSASVMVRKCASPDEAAWHALRIAREWPGTCGHILVEEYVPGPEFSAETFSGALVGVTEKSLGSEPHFVETGHLYPARRRDAGPVGAAARTVARLLGLEWGPAHLEMRRGPAGVRVIEVNPRLGGDFIPELIRLAQGIDLITDSIRLAAGATTSLAPSRRHFAAIRFLTQQADGLAVVTGVDTALGLPFVRDARGYPRPTARPVAGDSTDRVAHVILSAPTRAQLLAAVAGTAKALTVSMSAAAQAAGQSEQKGVLA
ncbi:MAG TPA: ATP-grasp domain-containing protein [Streptosporangiaceae bacterium]